MQARLSLTFLALLLATAACSSDENSGDNKGGGGGASGKGNTSTGGKGNNNTAGTLTSFGGAIHNGPQFAGADCPEIGLPDAYALPNVKGQIEGSNVRITFDPQADAKDYRVYVVPAKGDISGTTIKNATYRCAGRTEVPSPALEDAAHEGTPAVRTRVTTKVGGVARTEADATLGYVFTTPGEGRVPVYALGDPSLKAENVDCYYMRWHETRVKRYTTSTTLRDELLAKKWRDDGIAFYAFEPGAAGKQPIYSAIEKPSDSSATYYVKPGAEKDKRSGLDVTEDFSVLAETAEGAEPLMRVFYEQVCGRGHDELAAGLARFRRIYEQGAQPVTELHYSGLTEETTLVVEALDALCPYRGQIAPMSRAAGMDMLEDLPIIYPQFETPDELRAKSDVGELFINGQGDDTAPKAVARACLKVKPETPEKMDWSYDGAPETFSEPTNPGFQIWELESPTFNVQFHSVATDEWSVGSLFGEQWVTYADWAADTNGKMRMTPKTRATLSADKFVHATMEVDVIGTQRRYPQILISDGDIEWPIQNNLEKGTTFIAQVFGGITERMQLQLQFCDHRTWDVNKQCPKFNVDTAMDGGEEVNLPHPEVNAFFGIDRTVRFDVYASTSRVYVYTNGMPYACANLPAGKFKAGSAAVTFGDVLYHSAVDLEEWYPFHLDKMHFITSRHFSNLGFSSNVLAPSWDESRIPCGSDPKED